MTTPEKRSARAEWHYAAPSFCLRDSTENRLAPSAPTKPPKSGM